jgi:hypothetical protein
MQLRSFVRSRYRSVGKRSRIAAYLMLLALALVLPVIGRAQEEPPNRAGLVIQHGDGRVITACVSFSEPEITGLELLERAGISYLAQTSAAGAAVCKIDGEGCDYPAEGCFCKCTGAECVYWAYQRLRDGAWSYSQLGASATKVRPGDVDGWAWGSGPAGAQPPVLSFDQICAALPSPAAPEATEAAPPPSPLPPTEAAPLPSPPPPTTAATPEARPPASMQPSAPSAPAHPTRTAAPQATVASTGVAATQPPLPTREVRPTEARAPATSQATVASPAPAITATIGPAGGAAPTQVIPGAPGRPIAPGDYLAFAALVLLLVVGIAAALIRRRSRSL